MFWNDPNLYGATFPLKDVPVQTPLAALPWQNIPRYDFPRFLPQNFGYYPMLPQTMPQALPFTPPFVQNQAQPFTPPFPQAQMLPFMPHFPQTQALPYTPPFPQTQALPFTPPFVQPFMQTPMQHVPYPPYPPYNVNIPPFNFYRPYTW
jgi:hypothetical protein